MTDLKKLNWSFSSLGCPELTLPEIIELARSKGLHRLELRTIEDRVDLPAYFRETFGSPEQLRAFLDENGMSVVALDASLKLVGNKPEDRAALAEFAEWADALGTKWIRVFDGGTFAPTLSPEDMREAIATIEWWRAEKAKGGWKTDIMVETHDCLTATAAIESLQAELEEPLAILWDTHHTWKKGGENPADTWPRIKANVVHVHVKDSISEPSARHPFTYVQLGDGEFTLTDTLEMLAADRFGGVVSIEWERKWHPYLDPVETALTRARELGWW
jgi:sugar phosphate isomerase/epimerase